MAEGRRTGREARRHGWSRLSRPRRWTTIVLACVGLLITVLSGLLVFGAFVSDSRIEDDLGQTTAEVLSVDLHRTIVRYNTPEGAVYSPQTGVLYPDGLEEHDLVRVEYDRDDPELVRVAGRDFSLTLLPVSLVLLGTWAVLAGLVWWICRARRRTAPAGESGSGDAEMTPPAT